MDGRQNRHPSADFFEILKENDDQNRFFDLIAQAQSDRLDGQRSPEPSPTKKIHGSNVNTIPSSPLKSPPPPKGKHLEVSPVPKGNKAKTKKAPSSRPLPPIDVPLPPVPGQEQSLRAKKIEEVKQKYTKEFIFEDLTKCSFYLGALSRKEAEFQLEFYENGTFLLRESQGDTYVLSVRWDDSPLPGFCTHVKIMHNEELGFHTCEADGHPTVAELLKFYWDEQEVFLERFWDEANNAPPLIPMDPELHKEEIEKELSERAAQEELRKKLEEEEACVRQAAQAAAAAARSYNPQPARPLPIPPMPAPGDLYEGLPSDEQGNNSSNTNQEPQQELYVELIQGEVSVAPPVFKKQPTTAEKEKK